MITVRAGRAEPCATPSSAPIFSLVIAGTSSTSTSTPSLRNWLARRANSAGYSTFGGSLTSSRAMFTPSTRPFCGANAFLLAATSRTAIDTEAFSGASSSFFLVL